MQRTLAKPVCVFLYPSESVWITLGRIAFCLIIGLNRLSQNSFSLEPLWWLLRPLRDGGDRGGIIFLKAGGGTKPSYIRQIREKSQREAILRKNGLKQNKGAIPNGRSFWLLGSPLRSTSAPDSQVQMCPCPPAVRTRALSETQEKGLSSP